MPTFFQDLAFHHSGELADVNIDQGEQVPSCKHAP